MVVVVVVAGILLVVHSELGALGEVGGERAVVLLRGDGGSVQVVEDSPQLHLLLLYSLEGNLWLVEAVCGTFSTVVWKVLEVLLVGRLVVGLTAGLNTVLVPLYVSDIAPLAYSCARCWDSSLS